MPTIVNYRDVILQSHSPRVLSDNTLSIAEKPALILQYATILSQQTSMDAQATAYGLTALQATYDASIATLTAHLATLTNPVAWNNLTNTTNLPLTGTYLRSLISATVVAEANIATAISNSTLSSLSTIASSNILTPSGRNEVNIDMYAILQGQASLDSQAAQMGVSHTAYDAAISTLSTYLATLGYPSGAAWTSATGNIAIVGSTFIADFQAVYAAQQLLINATTGAVAALPVGLGNMINNSGPVPGDMTGYVTGFNTTGLTPILAPSVDPNRPTGQGGITVTSSGTPASGTYHLLQPNAGVNMPVVVGQLYELSSYIAAFNCTSNVYLNWLNSAGTIIGSAGGTQLVSNGSSTTTGILGNWQRSYLLATAPVGTASAAIYVETVYTGAATPKTCASMLYFAQAVTGQTALSAWVDGNTANWSSNVIGAPAVTASIVSAQTQANLGVTNASTANTQLASIASLNVLAMQDKPVVVQDFQAILNDQVGIAAQATAVGVSSTAYYTAINALNAYLGSLSPAWNDATQNTTIVGTTFDANFAAVYTQRQIVLNATAAAVAALPAGLGNMINNSGPVPGDFTGYVLDNNTTGLTPIIAASPDPYRPTGQGGVYVEFAGTPAAATYTLLHPNAAINIPVAALQTYEFSVYLGAYRTSAYVLIQWLNSSGAIISGAQGNTLTDVTSSGPLSGWARSFVIAQAPSGAVTANIGVLSLYTGEANPYTFCSMWYFAAAKVGQTLPSAWSDGNTANWATNVIGAAAINASILAAQNQIAAIGSTNVLSMGEKTSVIVDWNSIVNTQAGIDAQAAAVGVSHVAYDAAVSALSTYLGAMSPAWNDTTQNTTIVGATFIANWQAVYVAEQALLNAIGSATANAGGGNLLMNSDFGNGVNGYNAYNNGATPIATITAQSAGGAITPGTYVQVICNGAGSTSFGTWFASSLFGGFFANTSYVISFYAVSNGSVMGAPMNLGWNHSPATATWLLNPPLNGNWQRYAVLVNFGANTVDTGMFLTSTNMPAIGNVIDFSNLMVQVGSVPTAWQPCPVSAMNPITSTNSGSMVGAAAVTTTHLIPNAATYPLSAFTAAGTGSLTAATTVQTLTYTSTGAVTNIQFSLGLIQGAGVATYPTISITRNGTTIYSWETQTSTAGEWSFSAGIADTPLAGSVTYNLVLTPVSSSFPEQAFNRLLLAIEFRR
ncbi:beta strand repeat-containing protein [Solimicrobium silvestre]|uniref:Uncharacterized protein n=1 Tax=Solimicrobium silvestre TaxID=2099400 RepID=A0A2S9GY92_9BURK|nr:hypothetical protein [Solimicrobium silvestre]PRC92681.1 hypothetical protein S2091_2736 [Solimicrobium silvestre]